MMLVQEEAGKQNWAYFVKKALIENGFGIVWLCQGVGYENGFISELKDRLIASYKQNWHAQMECKEKYTWFFSFKSIFQTEKFIMIISNRWHRTNLAKFRLRTLGFNANKRWFETGTVTQSPCPICNSATDDENHFVFQCKSYDFIRKKCILFEKDVVRREDMTMLLRSNDEDIIKSFAKYISEAWDFRKKMINRSLDVQI